MPQPQNSDNGWTLPTLKEHLEAVIAAKDTRDQQRYDAQQKALEAALLAAEKAVATAMAAAEKAVVKAEMAAEKRFDAVNEFRGAYQDIISQQMPRVEAEQRLSALTEKVDDLKSEASKRAGHTMGLNAGWGILLSAVVMIATIVSVYVALHK
jgi:tetrahydromethanopterin S-methyltransferase subunit G